MSPWRFWRKRMPSLEPEVGKEGKGEDKGKGEGLGRREFLKMGACAVTFFGLGLYRCTPGDDPSPYTASGRPRAESTPDSRLPILWVEAGVCTGCGVSLLNSADPAAESLVPGLRLEFQETLMDGYGEAALNNLQEVRETFAGEYLLVVDGAVPMGSSAGMTVLGADREGNEITAVDLIQGLGQDCAAAMALGTCAAFGGIPTAAPNPGGYRPLVDVLGDETPLVRIPGCPPHPDWMVGALTALLTDGAGSLETDGLDRPLDFFGATVHSGCPRLPSYVSQDFATKPGDPTRCLYGVGCKGVFAKGDCPSRLWNGRSFCVAANHPCLACTAPGFPDAREDVGPEGQEASSPFFEELER